MHFSHWTSPNFNVDPDPEFLCMDFLPVDFFEVANRVLSQEKLVPKWKLNRNRDSLDSMSGIASWLGWVVFAKFP